MEPDRGGSIGGEGSSSMAEGEGVAISMGVESVCHIVGAVLEQGSAQGADLKCLEMSELEGAYLVGGVLDFTIQINLEADHQGCTIGWRKANCNSKLCRVIKGREKGCTILCLYNYGTGSVVSGV